MRALVTGHAGFVGSAFMRHLGDIGHEVWGIDLAHGDDAVDFFRRRCDARFDLVVHCAAVVGGRATIDGEPLRLATADLALDAALFDWALRTRPGRIVYFSSSAVYPPVLQQGSPPRRLKETATMHYPGSHDATYGMVKAVGERLAEEANGEGIRTHIFRPFSGYGETQALDYPFPSFIRRARQREQPFDIWGSGASARDWVHIDDIVGAVMAVLDENVTTPVNICTGRATTFDELAAMAMAAAGYLTCTRYLVDAPQGVHYRVGDPTLLEQFYRPKITLEEGIARAMEAA